MDDKTKLLNMLKYTVKEFNSVNNHETSTSTVYKVLSKITKLINQIESGVNYEN